MVTKIYANAVAKYNEGKLLSAEKLRRLTEAEFSDAVKMLCDYGYGGGTVNEQSYDIDAFIAAETSKLIAYATADAPDPYLARVLTARFLYGNAKAYYKARFTGENRAAAVYGMDDAELREGIEKGNYVSLPAPMADALARLDERFAESAPDPKQIDIALTGAMFADMLYCARKAKSKALCKFVIMQIDAANILAVLRARALSLPFGAVQPLFVAGGKADEEFLQSLYAAEDAAPILKDSPYDFLLGDGEDVDLPHIEAKCDDYLAAIWNKTADNMLSYAPFVHYFTAQYNEYKTVKLILTCRKYGADGEMRKRLRAFM